MSNNNKDDKRVEPTDNSSSENNPSSSESTVQPRRSARLLNKLDNGARGSGAAVAGRSKSPLKRANEGEQVAGRSRRQKISETAETAETSNNVSSAETAENNETPESNETPTPTAAPEPLPMPTPPSTTTLPNPQNTRRTVTTSPPIFSISIGFGSMPPSFSSTFINSTGSQQDIPPEVRQIIGNMTEGMQNGAINSRPTATMFRSAGDGVGIGITGISIPIGVMVGSGNAAGGANINAANTDEFLNLAQQMFQIIARGRSSTNSAPTSEEFATISEDLEPLLNDFFTRIVGGMTSTAPAGLSSDRIAQLPETTEKSEIDCSICREIGRVGEEKCVELPCKHSFHFECIEPWLKRVSSCPICRKVIE